MVDERVASRRGHRSELLFAVAVTLISRFLSLRDRLAGRLRRARADPLTGGRIVTQSIRSGRSDLDACFVAPETVPLAGAVLICHGIGETVGLWRPVQGILARAGIASLVFDYAGYGASQGSVHPRQMEQDAAAAFCCLQKLAPAVPTALLGFLSAAAWPVLFSRACPPRG